MDDDDEGDDDEADDDDGDIGDDDDDGDDGDDDDEPHLVIQDLFTDHPLFLHLTRSTGSPRRQPSRSTAQGSGEVNILKLILSESFLIMFSSFPHLSPNPPLLLRQELSLSKSKSHECELSGASREEMMMLGEVSNRHDH